MLLVIKHAINTAWNVSVATYRIVPATFTWITSADPRERTESQGEILVTAIPTRAQWQTQTSSVIRTRGGHNPELLQIDTLLALYDPNGDWSQSVEPLFKIRSKIEDWERRRLNEDSARTDWRCSNCGDWSKPACASW